MESMTGYAVERYEASSLSASVQIKSVNARYLEIKSGLSPELYVLEEQFRSMIQDHFSRGTFDIYISFLSSETESKSALQMKSWVKNYQNLSKKLGVKDDLNLTKVLKQSQLLGKNKLSEAQRKTILSLFKKALLKLKKARFKEGTGLKKVLELEVKELKKTLQEVKKTSKNQEQQIKSQWKEKLKKLELDVPKEKLAGEVALLLEKADITEEVKRLEVHLKEFVQLVRSKESLLGKKLDFFCQELYRECNTMASKSKSTDLTRLSVDLKTSVEKLRQQVQNIQ